MILLSVEGKYRYAFGLNDILFLHLCNLYQKHSHDKTYFLKPRPNIINFKFKIQKNLLCVFRKFTDLI